MPFFLGLFLIGACSGGDATDTTGPFPPPNPQTPIVSSVKVFPDTLSLQVGTTRRLRAAVLDAQSAEIAGKQVTWSSSDTAIARVSSSGVVTAIAWGGVLIRASAEGKEGQAAITVNPIPAATIIVSPSDAIVGVGEGLPFTAVALSARGDTLLDRTITWSVSDTAALSVNVAGVVTALRADEMMKEVSASARDASSNARVRVAEAISPSHNVRLEARDAITGALLNGARIGAETSDSVNFFGIVAPAGMKLGGIEGGTPGAGLYSFPLPTARWKLTVDQEGYRTAVVDSVRVTSGRPTSMFVRLQRP